MPKKRQSKELLAEVRRDRLNKHLNEVEELLRKWIDQLTTPNPFHLRESDESWATRPDVQAGQAIRFLKSSEEERRELWACRQGYVPSLEQDTASNHILHKHLRKRAVWQDHNEWAQRLNRIAELGSSLCEKATKMCEARRKERELTEDYMPVALRTALESASGRTPAKSFSQRPGFLQGVWYDGILIEKSASAQQVDEVREEYLQMISELAQSKEMKELAKEWQQVLILGERMRGLVQKAIKSSDILYPCQFCRRLWQE
jgi:hypothetical protein